MDIIFDCACAGISVMDGICDFASLLQATTNEMHEIEAITAHEEPSSTPRSGRNRKCCPYARHQLRRNRNRCPPSGREHRHNRNCCPQQYPQQESRLRKWTSPARSRCICTTPPFNACTQLSSNSPSIYSTPPCNVISSPSTNPKNPSRRSMPNANPTSKAARPSCVAPSRNNPFHRQGKNSFRNG